MLIEIDKRMLEEIAHSSIDKRKAEKKSSKEEKFLKQENIKILARIRAEEIVASIPDELEKAASKSEQLRPNLAIVAKIPIVNEHVTSIMSSRGYLNEADTAVLAAVEETLESISISGIDEIAIKQEMKNRTFMSFDGLDTNTGPCKHYYLEAKVILPFNPVSYIKF